VQTISSVGIITPQQCARTRNFAGLHQSCSNTNWLGAMIWIYGLDFHSHVSGQHSLKFALSFSRCRVLTVKRSPWKYPPNRGWRTKLHRFALKHCPYTKCLWAAPRTDNLASTRRKTNWCAGRAARAAATTPSPTFLADTPAQKRSQSVRLRRLWHAARMDMRLFERINDFFVEFKNRQTRPKKSKCRVREVFLFRVK
jgi:hypothetical protein